MPEKTVQTSQDVNRGLANEDSGYAQHFRDILISSGTFKLTGLMVNNHLKVFKGKCTKFNSKY